MKHFHDKIIRDPDGSLACTCGAIAVPAIEAMLLEAMMGPDRLMAAVDKANQALAARLN